MSSGVVGGSFASGAAGASTAAPSTPAATPSPAPAFAPAAAATAAEAAGPSSPSAAQPQPGTLRSSGITPRTGRVAETASRFGGQVQLQQAAGLSGADSGRTQWDVADDLPAVWGRMTCLLPRLGSDCRRTNCGRPESSPVAAQSLQDLELLPLRLPCWR